LPRTEQVDLLLLELALAVRNRQVDVNRDTAMQHHVECLPLVVNVYDRLALLGSLIVEIATSLLEQDRPMLLLYPLKERESGHIALYDGKVIFS
jgi:hypothetical protein